LCGYLLLRGHIAAHRLTLMAQDDSEDTPTLAPCTDQVSSDLASPPDTIGDDRRTPGDEDGSTDPGPNFVAGGWYAERQPQGIRCEMLDDDAVRRGRSSIISYGGEDGAAPPSREDKRSEGEDETLLKSPLPNLLLPTTLSIPILVCRLSMLDLGVVIAAVLTPAAAAVGITAEDDELPPTRRHCASPRICERAVKFPSLVSHFIHSLGKSQYFERKVSTQG